MIDWASALVPWNPPFMVGPLEELGNVQLAVSCHCFSLAKNVFLFPANPERHTIKNIFSWTFFGELKQNLKWGSNVARLVYRRLLDMKEGLAIPQFFLLADLRSGGGHVLNSVWRGRIKEFVGPLSFCCGRLVGAAAEHFKPLMAAPWHGKSQRSTPPVFPGAAPALARPGSADIHTVIYPSTSD